MSDLCVFISFVSRGCGEEGVMAFGVLCLGRDGNCLLEGRLLGWRPACSVPLCPPAQRRQHSPVAKANLWLLLPCPSPYFQGFRLQLRSKLAVCNFLLSPNAYFQFLLLCPLSISLLYVRVLKWRPLESRIWLSTEHLILPP